MAMKLIGCEEGATLMQRAFWGEKLLSSEILFINCPFILV